MPTIPKVLISAYACSPNYGSEVGMGWNWVNQIAKYCETWVLTDEYYAKDCRAFLSQAGCANPLLHIIGIPRPGGRSRIYGYFWLHYLTQNLWQRQAFKMAQKLHAEEQFDLIHQLNMIGYREPGYLWRLAADRPFIWGPIGGHAQIPQSFIADFPLQDRLVYSLRNVLNAWQMRHSRRVRAAMRRADVLFGATRPDIEAIAEVHGRQAILLHETGTSFEGEHDPTSQSKTFDPTRPLQLVWSGVFIGSKALPLGLQALARARQTEPGLPICLTILGGGNNRATWQRLAADLGLSDCCTWTGWLPHDQAKQHILAADALLFTSLKEATSTVVPEALMQGVPVICHDACGFGDVVTEQCGIKVPMIDPQTSIEGFSAAILLLARDRRHLATLAEGARLRARSLTWSRHVHTLLDEYFRLCRQPQLR